MVVCVTSPNPMDSAGLVQMEFDRETVSFDKQTYHYKQDPIITSVYPEQGIRRCVFCSSIILIFYVFNCL